MSAFSAARMRTFCISNSPARITAYKPEYRCRTNIPCVESSSRRSLVIGSVTVSILSSLNSESILFPAVAEEGPDKDEGVVGALKTLLDPNEKNKLGKVLPKAYLKSAREVVKTLRESLNEDTKDNAKFRRMADAAKESIREYLNVWRGQKSVIDEESYAMLEKAIRSLASFYSKAGPSAPLSEKVKAEILKDLNTAEEFL